MTIEVHKGEAGAQWINATGGAVDDAAIKPHIDRVGREIANWVSTQRQKPSLYHRQAYVAPDNPFTQMQTARKAVENDDVVGGVCDVTEGLMLQGVQWESGEADETDIFNQMSRDLNLDAFARQWHREEYMHSQVIVGVWWGRNTYTIRGKSTNGVKRKKKVTLTCPRALTFLDPSRVVPLRPGPFGQDRLAWHATKEEYAAAVASYDNAFGDPVLREFTLGPTPELSKDEREYLGSIGVDPKRLLMINPGSVFRHTRTKMSYERFPTVRLRSVFPLLDLKQQLMEADRVNLVGAANYILLVRQGSKDEPAAQAELDNLQENFKVVAKLPVVIGDHRLSIDIITPDQTHVLDHAKYNTLDQRIMARALGAMSIATSGQRNESTLTIARGIARLLETRRHMMKRSLEEHIARRVVEHPANAGVFSEEPKLTFTPRNVQLDNDGETVRAILALRTQKELSRESTLEFFGFDQATEALRREFEEEFFDDIFQTQVPFSAAGMPGGEGAPGAEGQGEEPSQVSGARGGRPKGGGDSPQSVDGQVKGRTAKGNPKG